MPEETPLSRKLERFLYETGDEQSTLLLQALVELAKGIEAVEEKVLLLTREVRAAAEPQVGADPFEVPLPETEVPCDSPSRPGTVRLA